MTLPDNPNAPLHLVPFRRARGQAARGVAAPYPACYVLSGDWQTAPTLHAPDALKRPFTPGTRPFRLKLLHLNDLHGHVARLTPHGAQPVLARIAWRVRQLRQQAARDPNTAVLFLSAGDEMAGSIFDALLVDAYGQYGRHAAYQLYSQLGLAAGALGNHDLDVGPRLLAQAICRDARFPILAANVHAPPDAPLRAALHAAAVIVVKGVRVGLIGVTTPAQIKPQPRAPLHVSSPLRAVQALLPALRPYCDVLVILSHLGYGPDGDAALAGSLPPGAAHLIVGGHSHHALNETGLCAANVINQIPIVQAGALGRFLGEVTVTLNGGTAVTDARLTPAFDLPLHESFDAAAVQPLLRCVQPYLQHTVGRAAAHPDLGSDAVHNSFCAGESALANFITDAIVERCRWHGFPVDAALIDSSVVRCGLTPGAPFTVADWINVMPTIDTIRLVRLSGRALLALLQDNARRIDQLHEPAVERGFFHASRQLRYQVTPAARRADAAIAGVTFCDQELNVYAKRTFLIAVHSCFRHDARAWEQAWVAQERPLFTTTDWLYEDTGLFLRQELLAAIHHHGGLPLAARDGRLQLRQPQPERFIP